MKRILGIDYGEKRVGLALSDLMQLIASPFKTIPNNSSLFTALKKIIDEYEVEKVVVGLPKGMKGQETQQTKFVRNFITQLEDNNILVDLEDERLSSITAKKSLIQQGIKTGHNKGLIDQTAAAIFLQLYLDRQ
ncbi:MAG: Holliday junction resolvase RuvX [Fidelibacterota bacterium]